MADRTPQERFQRMVDTLQPPVALAIETYSQLSGLSQRHVLKEIQRGNRVIRSSVELLLYVSCRSPTLTITANADAAYHVRTRRNVAKADVTMAFAADYSTAGEKLTARLAADKLVQWDGRSLSTFAAAIVAKLSAVQGTSVNVAGNGIFTWAKHNVTQPRINVLVTKLLDRVKNNYPALTTVISGGQTGSDIAGAVAGVVLGLDVDVHMPKGFKQRDTYGLDFVQSAANVETYIRTAATQTARTIVVKTLAAHQAAVTTEPLYPGTPQQELRRLAQAQKWDSDAVFQLLATARVKGFTSDEDQIVYATYVADTQNLSRLRRGDAALESAVAAAFGDSPIPPVSSVQTTDDSMDGPSP